MTTTHFPNGINNATLPSVFEDMGQLDPSKFHNFFEDFNVYNASDWTVTKVGAATESIQDEDGGVLKLTNAAADDDSDFLQFANEVYKFETGKAIFFKSRFKISEVIQSELIIGLQIRDTTPLEVTDGVFFRKNDGTAVLNFRSEKNNVSTGTFADNITTLVNDTYITIGFFYNGSDKIFFFVDDKLMGSIPTNINLPDDEELTISFGIQNGEAALKTMSTDYIFVAKER